MYTVGTGRSFIGQKKNSKNKFLSNFSSIADSFSRPFRSFDSKRKLRNTSRVHEMIQSEIIRQGILQSGLGSLDQSYPADKSLFTG